MAALLTPFRHRRYPPAVRRPYGGPRQSRPLMVGCARALRFATMPAQSTVQPDRRFQFDPTNAVVLGVMGDYGWIYDEARERPKFIIESRHGFDEEE